MERRGGYKRFVGGRICRVRVVVIILIEEYYFEYYGCFYLNNIVIFCKVFLNLLVILICIIFR